MPMSSHEVRPLRRVRSGLLECLALEVTEMATKRTTHRSTTGTKLYAVRDAQGRFKDIQTYKRAQGSDIKRKSKTEK
jgi:hypothetical protein